VFATTLTCDIKNLTVTVIAINIKDNFNDCNMSVAMVVARFILLHDY
jgi:hypothetical protein